MRAMARTRLALVVLFALALAAAVCPGRGECGRHFRFVFMADIHIQPERGGVQGFQAAVTRVNELAPDFVITGGDLVFDALDVPFDRAVQLYRLYSEGSRELKMPVHNTIGNHEVFGLYDTTGVSRRSEEYGKEMFKKRLGRGATCESFDHDGWHFILLDVIHLTEEHRYIGRADPEVLEWLRSDLARVRPETPIVLSVHIPLASVYEQMRRGACAALLPSEGVENSREVLDAFQGHDLRLVLQAHLHIYEDISFKNTRFVTGGAVCGAWWQGSNEGVPEGFVVVDIDGGRIDCRYETYGWDAAKHKASR
jgi:Icc protein